MSEEPVCGEGGLGCAARGAKPAQCNNPQLGTGLPAIRILGFAFPRPGHKGSRPGAPYLGGWRGGSKDGGARGRAHKDGAAGTVQRHAVDATAGAPVVAPPPLWAGFAFARAALRDHVFHDGALHIREAHFAPGVPERELLVVQPEQV